MIVVLVTPVRGADPEPVGPFPDGEWAKRYCERVQGRYFHTEITWVMSPRIIGEVDGKLDIVFDPEKGVDR